MATTTHSKIKKISPLLLVANMHRSIDFYTNQLGFAIDFLYEDFYAGISKDGFSVHLKLRPSFNEERQSNENPEIVFSVEGVESLYEELLYKAVTFAQALRNMPYGKEFYIADPDGNIIAFVEEA